MYQDDMNMKKSYWRKYRGWTALMVLLIGVSCHTEPGGVDRYTDSDGQNPRVMHGAGSAETGGRAMEDPAGRDQSAIPVKLPHVTMSQVENQVSEIPQLRSFMLYQEGEIQAEVHRGNRSRNQPVNIKSASKSVMSALIGIAIDRGYIRSVDDPVAYYLPDYFRGGDEPAKEEITIRHLLTMTSGLRSTSFRNYGAWVASRDWVGHVIRGPLERDPGERMRYSTGDTHLLSAVLTEASGMSSRSFAQRYLFDPMGIRVGGWDRDPAGYYFGGNNMALSPAGLVEFGKLYLQMGVHDGRQLLPAEWVMQSMTRHQKDVSYNYRNHDYGYLWWQNEFAGYDAWFAWGYGGQYVFVMPALHAVAVFTGNPSQRSPGGNSRIYDVLEGGVIPALHHARKAVVVGPRKESGGGHVLLSKENYQQMSQYSD